MSRTVRLAVAALAVAGVALPAGPAFADPDPPCRLTWSDEPFVRTTGLPVYAEVHRPQWTC